MIPCSTCGRPAQAAYLLPSQRAPERVEFACGWWRHNPYNGSGVNGHGFALERIERHIARLREEGHDAAAELIERAIAQGVAP